MFCHKIYFKIYNGYLKSSDLHRKNSSVKKLEVSDENGNKVILNLNNQMGVQRFDLNFSGISMVRFEILDIYKGSIDDTLITKIEFK